MTRYSKAFRSKSCDEFATELVLYAYGKIASEERAGIENHLDACASCRERQDQLLHELATAPLDFPPPRFWDEYGREMRQKLAAVDEKKQKAWLTPFRFRTITAVAAGLVLVLALGIALRDSIFSNGEQPHEDAMMRVLPIVQNLEFFESMHYLEMMDQENNGDIKSSAVRRAFSEMIAWTHGSPRRKANTRQTHDRFGIVAAVEPVTNIAGRGVSRSRTVA